MRMPYVVGRWVRGQNHYGRERLIEQLLEGPDTAIWLVGTRRMGKTSLLRQLEMIASNPASKLVPIFWDLQGSRTVEELSDELYFALEDVADRFQAVGIDIEIFRQQDAVTVLRALARLLAESGRQLLVLIDESEVLIQIAQQDPDWMGRLRRILQDERVRTVLTSTKLLSQLNHISRDWTTSPFLFGFSLVNLTKLEERAARALVRQLQAEQPVEASDGVVDDILIHTNGQPYLIQYLCQRLFESDGERGYLRPITDEDLATDHILAGFFQIDFRHLSRSERRLVLAVADLTIARESELLALFSDLSPRRIKMLLYGLERLGYLRNIFGQWAVGNEFLRRWVVDHMDELTAALGEAEDDNLHESMLAQGRLQEAERLRREIAEIEQQLAQIELAAAEAEGDEALRLLEEIDQLRHLLNRLRKELASIEAALDP